MDSVDLEVLRKSAQWQAEGRRVLLVTVVRTWGSSPRPPGAMLAVREDGQVVGSVSGGCIEDDIVERSRREGAVRRRDRRRPPMASPRRMRASSACRAAARSSSCSSP